MKSFCVLALTLFSIANVNANKLVTKAINPITNRALGGVEATPNEAPYIVSLQLNYYDGRQTLYFCGGSIVAEYWITTAGICTTVDSAEGVIEAVAGQHHLMEIDPYEQLRQVNFVYAHPYWGGGASPFDIAMLRVSSPFTFNQYVSAIGLPIPNTTPTGSAILFAWGTTSNAQPPSFSETLQRVTKDLIDFTICQLAVGGAGSTPLHPTNLCTGPLSGGIGTCTGDAGSPLVQNNILIGIVTWFFSPCGTVGAPSVYTSVTFQTEWINSIQIAYPPPPSQN